MPAFTCYRLHETLHGRVPDELDEYIDIEHQGKVVVVGAEYLGVKPPWIRITVIDESQHEGAVVLTWDSVAAAESA